MIKISALKEDSEESSAEDDVTKEAQEQIALQQYTKALELHRQGNLPEATQLLKDLLDTELLKEIKKPPPGQKITGPLFNLKYLCYKNLGNIFNITGDIEGAIAAYDSASELDNTDLIVWHRLGLNSYRGKHYEKALYSFQKGIEINPKHWPCLDKIVTLLLGLDYKEDCIATIYETLNLDPGYLRGLVYRRYIYKTFPFIRDYMEYLNPIYKWDEKEDDIDESKAEKLLDEVKEIHKNYLEQNQLQQHTNSLPDLDLSKPIIRLTWLDVGESLYHMHNYITENSYSHACYINILSECKNADKSMEDCLENQLTESPENKCDESLVEREKKKGNYTDSNQNLDKTAETDKINESDMEAPQANTLVVETKRKAPARRRGSALSFLQQWEWCKNRRSCRKKTANTKDRFDDSIYETLRRMIPIVSDTNEEQNKDENDTEKKITNIHTITITEKEIEQQYFNTKSESKDVKEFITKYTEKKYDIIDMLREYLIILAEKWMFKWPENLAKIFVKANECYNNHTDVPPFTEDAKDDILHFTKVKLLAEECIVNEKLLDTTDKKPTHEISVIENVGFALILKPHFFSGQVIFELMLRYLWVKLHIHLLNKSQELGLDCLYHLTYEFEAMGEHRQYSLDVVNFTFKPIINNDEISTYIKFLERNKRLSIVKDLYDRECYEDVLATVTESFEYCKNMERNHEEEMSLDFAVQLTLILDAYWALGDTESCLKWSFTCLHEALKHFFRYTSGSTEYNKWTLTVVKILCCMEQVLASEGGLSYLDDVPQKEVNQGCEDLIRIIGHQVETNASDMPFGTVVPWIVLHYILQREDDMGRGRVSEDKDKTGDEIPIPLMVLFIAHEQLGMRSWCCISNGKLLYFILDTVVPRLRSPAMAKCLEQIVQYMEQCVYCLYGHPGKKNKLKYLVAHNVTAHTLDWARAQQVYEIYRPSGLPALEGKVSGITADTEQLFHRILKLLPSECNPSKYVVEIEKFIRGTESKAMSIPPLLPYKMKDIYHLLGDYYFKKEEGKMAIKYNILDVIINSNRLESWAEISLAKATNLERLLNSCKNLNNEKEFLNTAKCTIRCFKRTLDLDPTHCNMWIEYGMFVYTVHSFCSRLLRQASESLSMDDFELLEKQKEDMLDRTQTCFMAVLNDMNNTSDSDKTNEDSWLHYYMLGKVAEKRNKSPSVYLNYYMQAVKCLQETDATYPSKINYSSPTHLCIEVLELHYRIHASILKYIEQHENKPIPSNIGKVFSLCIEQWKNGPFDKNAKKEGTSVTVSKPVKSVHAANILKRSASYIGEENTNEAKKLKSESAAAKIKRSASYGTESIVNKQPPNTKPPKTHKEEAKNKKIKSASASDAKIKIPEENWLNSTGKKETRIEIAIEEKEESSSSASSSSSSSSDSSSDSSSGSSQDSDTSSKTVDVNPLTDEEIMTIISACLDSLEDCASRFPPHYKAIYRLAHYHFYYKKGKDIERCRDLMLSTFIARSGQKLGGMFSERKPSNLFNNIWKIPVSEVDRAGGFVFHMSRSVLLTMEILKEIDDHKTLLDMSLHLQRIPDQDKKYLRDGDREELAQQAFSLCVQSLKGQLQKFIHQADLKSNEVERQALKSLMLDIYRAYQRAQKQQHLNCKQFTNLLIDAYKLVSTQPIAQNANLADLSLKYCQSIIQTLKQQATQASLDKSQNAQKKQAAKVATMPQFPKRVASTSKSSKNSKTDYKAATASTAFTPSFPKPSPHDMMSAFQNYMPMLNAQDLSRQTAAVALWSNLNAIASYSPAIQQKLQASLQTSLQNSFQAEYFLQFLGQSLSSYQTPPKPKLKRGPKPGASKSSNMPMSASTSKSQYTANTTKTPVTSTITKAQVTTTTSKAKVTTSASKSKAASSSQQKMPKSYSTLPSSKTMTAAGIQKSASNLLAPSMGTVLSTLPASMSNLSSFGISSSIHTGLMPSSRSTPTVHLTGTGIAKASSGKTLQEKLAERQLTNKNKDLNVMKKLPASLTITKTSTSKTQQNNTKTSTSKTQQNKKMEPKKDTTPAKSKISEVIVLDDD